MLYNRLLRKLEELCCRLAPIVSDAVSEHSRLLSNRRLVGRYESVSEFAHAVLGEMLNLDRAVAVSVAASNAVASGSATGLTPSQARQTQRQDSIAATAAVAAAGGRSCSGSKHVPASAEARFDAAAAVEAAKAAGFGWTAPASSVTPTSVSASTKTSGFASCLARLRSKGHGSKAAAAAASCAFTEVTSATCGTTAAPTSPTCASTPTTATSGATPCSNALQQSSQEAVWSASFSASLSQQQQQQQRAQQRAPTCAEAAPMQLQQLHAADTFCSATSRAVTACGLSSGAGGLSTAVTAADGLPSAVTSSALPSGALASAIASGGAPCKPAATSPPTQSNATGAVATLNVFKSLAPAASLPLPAVCTALSAQSPSPTECDMSDEHDEEGASDEQQQRRQCLLSGSGTARTLPSPPAEIIASVRDLVDIGAFTSGLAAEPTAAAAHSGAASAMAASRGDALALEATQASRSTRSLSCLEFSGASLSVATAEALASPGNGNSSGVRSGRGGGGAGTDVVDTVAQAVQAHMKYDSSGSPFCGVPSQEPQRQQRHQQQRPQEVGPGCASAECSSVRSSGDGRDLLYGRDAGFMMDGSSTYGSGEWHSGIAPGGAGASAGGCGGYMLSNSGYSSRGGSRVMQRGVPIEPSIGPISVGLYGSTGPYGSGSAAARGFAASASAAAAPYVRVGGGVASACASERSVASRDTTATLATTTFASSMPMGAGTSTTQLTASSAGNCAAGASALDFYVCAAASAAPDGATAEGACGASAAAAAAGPSSRWSRDSAAAAAAMWGSEASDAIAAAMQFTSGVAPAPRVPISSQGAAMLATHRTRGGCAVPLGGPSGAGQLFGIRESGPMPSASTLIGSGSGGLPRGCRSAGSASGCNSGSGASSGPCSSGDVRVSILDLASAAGMTARDVVSGKSAAKERVAVACGPAAAAHPARW